MVIGKHQFLYHEILDQILAMTWRSWTISCISKVANCQELTPQVTYCRRYSYAQMDWTHQKLIPNKSFVDLKWPKKIQNQNASIHLHQLDVSTSPPFWLVYPYVILFHMSPLAIQTISVILLSTESVTIPYAKKIFLY